MKGFIGLDIAAKMFEMVVREGGKNARPVSFEQTAPVEVVVPEVE